MSNENVRDRILIVDDEEPIRHLFSETFTKAGGYDVETARDGYEAVEKAMSEDFDVILMDMMMPGMNGLDAIKALKITRPMVPILIVTGGTDQIIAEGLASGAAMAFRKPVVGETLVQAVRNILTNVGKSGRKEEP